MKGQADDVMLEAALAAGYTVVRLPEGYNIAVTHECGHPGHSLVVHLSGCARAVTIAGALKCDTCRDDQSWLFGAPKAKKKGPPQSACCHEDGTTPPPQAGDRAATSIALVSGKAPAGGRKA